MYGKNDDCKYRKKVLILSHFSDGAETGNDRFNYLASTLSKSFDVELITSSFFHTKKKQHDQMASQLPYQLRYVFEPGYTKNVSLKRFHSHMVLGKNTKKYLMNIEKPDLIYCAIPSIDMAYAAWRYANGNGIPFVLDIQDLWPEAFQMVFKVPVISDIVFTPMLLVVNRIYKNSDEIVAVSDTYCKRALNYNKRGAKGYTLYLGTDKEAFDAAAADRSLCKLDNEFWIAYAGTLGHSYNIKAVLNAMKILQEKGYQNIKLLVMGDGPLKEEFEKYASDNKINAHFLGRLNYNNMAGILKASDIAVNPIQSNSAASIINKHGDYAMAGLPVISTQESQEYIHLLETYNAGYTCSNESPAEMAELIKSLYHNHELRKEIGKNSRRLGEDLFDRKKTYGIIEGLINRFLKDKS